MDTWICETCGTAFPRSEAPPPACPICGDERQYLPQSGPRWTSRSRFAAAHANTFRQPEPDVLAIETVPHFAIGQRAFLVRTRAGNVLWDCLTLVDEATVTLVKALGGLAAIAISHPHYYSAMGEWSAAFGDVPVYLHEADRRWVVDPGPHLAFWSGDRRDLLPGLTLLRCGGHFAGAAVLHWSEGAGRRGALFCGDTLQVVPDRRHVSIMRSYPNLVPVSAGVIDHVGAVLEPWAYDRVYGAFDGRTIDTGGKAGVAASLARYRAAIAGDAGADAELGP